MKEKIKRIIVIILTMVIAEMFLSLNSINAYSLVGDIKLLDNSDNLIILKSRNENPMLVFYVDPDRQNINRPIMKYLLKNISIAKKINIVTIANCNVSWIPYEIVKQRYTQMAKKNIGKFYYDRTGGVQRMWKMPNCNNSGMVVIIGKDGNIKFLKKIRRVNESRSAIPVLINILKKEIHS